MKYQEFINNIINTRGLNGIEKPEYFEIHHIIPKCIGGTNDENNLIRLYPNEHFIAHKLLYQENPHEKKLAMAWWCMAYLNKNSSKYEITPEEYAKARVAFSEARQGHIVSQVTRDKLKEYFTGHKVSVETRKKISEKLKGNKLSEETKHKLSEIKKKNFTPELREKLKKANTGRTCSLETKEKISKANKGRIFTKEHKEKISKAKKGKASKKKGTHLTEEQKLKLSKPINQYDLNDIFIKSWDSVKTASKELNICASNICRCCKGKSKTAGGYKWRYKNVK